MAQMTSSAKINGLSAADLQISSRCTGAFLTELRRLMMQAKELQRVAQAQKTHVMEILTKKPGTYVSRALRFDYSA